MIKGMPQYAQKAISSYLDTGKFKDHQNVPNPGDAASNTADVQNFRENMDEFKAADNVEGLDQDPRPGHIKMDGFFSVSGKFETAADGTEELFQVIGSGEESAVMYMRDDGETLDTIAVHPTGSSDEGVMHYNVADHTKSFTSFQPE